MPESKCRVLGHWPRCGSKKDVGRPRVWLVGIKKRFDLETPNCPVCKSRAPVQYVDGPLSQASRDLHMGWEQCALPASAVAEKK